MIEIRNLTKTFETADGSFDALKDINLTVNDGDIYGIIGMSGAGKSTLVRCINMLERPTAGEVFIDGVNVGALSEKELRNLRRGVTMIFQSFNLLMQRTCLGNVCFPLELAGVKKAEAEKKAYELLDMVGLPDKANAYPAQLSGGQQQRIAIARALATNPKILLCDEATSALDPKTTHQILELLRDINRRLGITCVVITHQMSVVEEICNRVAILDHGTVAEEGNVEEVFSSPRTDAARRLVYPETLSDTEKNVTRGEKKIRVVFNGINSTASPLLTKMAIDLNLHFNIYHASTRRIGDKIWGNMILGMPDLPEADNKVREYLSKCENVSVTDDDVVSKNIEEEEE